MNRFDEDNSTLRWIPRFLREFLGLTSEAPRSRSGEPSYDPRTAGGLVPEGVKRFFGLTFDEPRRYEGGTSRPSSSPPAGGAPPAGGGYKPGASSYTPGSPSSYTPGSPSSYTPGSPSSYTPRQSDATPDGPANRSRAGDIPAATDLQPVGYLLHSYARGALPPEGLESFTRQTRGTTESVYKFYTHWLRYQTEEIARIGGDIFGAVVDSMPSSRPAAPTTIRRIKVTAGDENGNGNGHGNGHRSGDEPKAEG